MRQHGDDVSMFAMRWRVGRLVSALISVDDRGVCGRVMPCPGFGFSEFGQ
jgi:hypothetical protein